MVGQTRGPPRPNMAPPRSFHPAGSPPPPSSEPGRTSSAAAPSDSESLDPMYPAATEGNVPEDDVKPAPATDAPTQKPQTNNNNSNSYTSNINSNNNNNSGSSSSSGNASHQVNQKSSSPQREGHAKMSNSEVTHVTKKPVQVTNNQILSVYPSGKSVESVKAAVEKAESQGPGTKKGDNQPNFLTMQQKINEKLLANQIPVQKLADQQQQQQQQFILKQVGSSDNIVAVTTAKMTESNQNYFAMLTNKPQTNYVNYLSLPVSQQNFITVEQQQKNNYVVMETGQSKANYVTVPAGQKSAGTASSGQTYLVHGNGADLKQFNSYLAVTTKPGDTNGTTFFTMTPTKHGAGGQTAYLMTPKPADGSGRTFVAVAQKQTDATYLALPANKNNEPSKTTTTFIAMEPNKADGNIIVTQVLPPSQQSQQVFQLEYADGEGGVKAAAGTTTTTTMTTTVAATTAGKCYNSRDGSATQSPVVPKMSCNAVSSTVTGSSSSSSSNGSVMSTKTVSAVPPLTASAPAKRSATASKALTSSPVKANLPPPTGNASYLSSPTATTTASSTNETRWNTESSETGKSETSSSSQETGSSPGAGSGPAATVLSSNVPHSHQYLIPNMDNLKLAAESINKMMPGQSSPAPGHGHAKPPGMLKVHHHHQADHQSFQMHNYSKNDASGYHNHTGKSGASQESSRRKYVHSESGGKVVQQASSATTATKNVIKYSHNMYSNHQRGDKNQSYGSYKSRAESRPTNHQRMGDVKGSAEMTRGVRVGGQSDHGREEAGDVDVEDTRVGRRRDGEDEGAGTGNSSSSSNHHHHHHHGGNNSSSKGKDVDTANNDDEEEGVEVRPVFDMRIPLVFQVVLTDHCYGMPMLLLRNDKPAIADDDKESVISSDGKGEDGEETETAAEGEDSITRCICDLEHDDGYMVCCDKCSVWQHVACVFPDVRVGTPLPEEYLCDVCHPRKLDRNRARALQLQRRKQIFNNSDSSDSSSSSLEIAPRSKDTGPKKAVARRRVDPIPRKPMKLGKVDPGHNDSVVKNSIAKPRRRDSNLKLPAQVGRRTKLKRKLESRLPRTVVRRKSKNKESLKPDKNSSGSGSSGGNNNNNNNNNNNYHQKERRDRHEGSDGSIRKSPDLRTRLQMLKSTSLKELGVKPSSRVRCRMSHLPQGDAILVTSCTLSRGQLIVEIRGKFLLSEEPPVKSECLFFYRFPKDGSQIVVDGSGHENLTRYARRSCRPNTQMKHCIVKGSLRLYLIAVEDMGKNQEITIAHNTISDTSYSQKDGCLCRSKDCPFFLPKNSQTTATERRKRGRRRTVSEESEGSPVKGKKDSKVTAEPVRRNSSMTHSSRSPSSPIQQEVRSDKEKDRKLTRDERKIEQAMKIFAQMERDTARKKDKDRPQMSVASQRKDSQASSKMDSDKESPIESNKSRRRRRRRRRRSRKVRLSSTASSTTLNQYNSGDSDLSSGDELPSPSRKGSSKDSRDDDLQSPIEKMSSPRDRRTRRDSCSSSSREKEKRNDAAGLLLALGGRYLPGQKTPTREKESETEGSPPTPLSSACLLVAAAVGPLAPGFRFPKTKKGLMNEWLSKSPEHSTQDFSPTPETAPLGSQSESSLPPGAPKLSNLSNRLFSFPVESKSPDLKENVRDSRGVLDGRVPSGTPAGFGKKRWLRQAISEECDTPQGQGSPPCPPDNVTPLKKRRLARESLSSDPPTTPPMPPITTQTKEDRIYVGDLNSPESPTIIDTESEISLAERVDALRREYLEAQERNLLKTYGRYENECTTRSERDTEEYERYNNFQTSPQRVPENLSYNKVQEEKSSEDSSTAAAPAAAAATTTATATPAEKPLDLTGEREGVGEGGEESEGDGDGDSQKVESSPRNPSRRGRGRKSAGGKRGDNGEVRTSPRFRKGAKSRRTTEHRDGKGSTGPEGDEHEPEEEDEDVEEDEQEEQPQQQQQHQLEKVSDECGQNGVDESKKPRQTREVPEPGTRNADPRLTYSGYIKRESSVDGADVKPVPVPVKCERPCFGVDGIRTEGGGPVKVEKLNSRTSGSEGVDCKRETDLPEVKVENSDDKIVQNGYENVAVRGATTTMTGEDDEEDRNDRRKQPRRRASDEVRQQQQQHGLGVKFPDEKPFKGDVVPENAADGSGGVDPKSEDLDPYSSASADKSAPIKRKLSITEYLKRKKSGSNTGTKSMLSAPLNEDETGATISPHEGMSPLTSSPGDSEGRSRLSLPAPTLPPVFFEMDKGLEKPGSGVRFKSEPTELERQRENLTERLRREFGLLIADDEPKPMKPMDAEDLMPPPPPPPTCPYPPYPAESADFMDPIGKRSLYHPPTQSLPQSAIYPVGSSNPPNPCSFGPPYSSLGPLPTHAPSHEDKRKDRKNKKFRQ